MHPQLAVVPAQYGVNTHALPEHVSAVQALPSLHCVHPLRTTRAFVTAWMQLVPLHVNVRYSWFWHEVQRSPPLQHA